MLKCHIIKTDRFGGRGAQTMCGRIGFRVKTDYGNDFTFVSRSGKTRFQAIACDRPEPRPRVDCEACKRAAVA